MTFLLPRPQSGIRSLVAIIFHDLILLLIALQPTQAQPLSIVAGSAAISDISQNFAGSSANIRTLIPGGACPGHYDLSPGDISAVTNADVVLLHSWQTNLYNIKQLILAAGDLQGKLHILETSGSWMIPERQITASEEIARVLSKIRPDLAQSIETTKMARVKRIEKLARDSKTALEKLKPNTISVLADNMQKDFALWTGLQLSASFSQLDDSGPRSLASLAALAKQNNVRLVIDNLQSGAASGGILAREVGAKHIVLTNFPGATERGLTWEESFKGNISRIESAITREDDRQ